jgi:hypothetical protein
LNYITACAEPPAVQNGTYTVELINSQYVVQYQCDSGLLLIGNDLPVCQPDTNWTKPTLLCTGMYELMHTLYGLTTITGSIPLILDY